MPPLEDQLFELDTFLEIRRCNANASDVLRIAAILALGPIFQSTFIINLSAQLDRACNTEPHAKSFVKKVGKALFFSECAHFFWVKY